MQAVFRTEIVKKLSKPLLRGLQPSSTDRKHHLSNADRGRRALGAIEINTTTMRYASGAPSYGYSNDHYKEFRKEWYAGRRRFRKIMIAIVKIIISH